VSFLVPRALAAVLALGLAGAADGDAVHAVGASIHDAVGRSLPGRLDAGAESAGLRPASVGRPFQGRQELRALTADEVARAVRDRDTGRDSRTTLRMKLFDRHGRARERALTLLTLRGAGRAGARVGTRGGRTGDALPDGDRLLIRFTYPNDIKGTSFLVWEHPASEDERFLYLPSLGRVRRIAGTETQESFVGSDFTYEDIGGREFDEYTYAILDEQASWTAPDGASRPAWRLESRRKDTSSPFPRVVSLVLKDTFVVVQADIYNRRNEKQKAYTVRRLEAIDRVWTAMDSQMTNAIEQSRTELTVDAARYNVGLAESDFSRRELDRGVPK
jgi:hypothetical protein